VTIISILSPIYTTLSTSVRVIASSSIILTLMFSILLIIKETTIRFRVLSYLITRLKMTI
jgi:hypothetical protein